MVFTGLMFLFKWLGHKFYEQTRVPIFFIDLFFFLISSLNVVFYFKRLHGCLSFFFIGLSKSHDMARGFVGLTHVDSLLFFFSFL